MSIPKQTAEFLLIGKEMAQALATGESLAASNTNGSLAANAFNSDGDDVTSTIIEAGTVAIDGTVVTVMVNNAAVAGVYNIQLLIPTSNDQILEEDLTLAVIDRTG